MILLEEVSASLKQVATCLEQAVTYFRRASACFGFTKRFCPNQLQYPMVNTEIF